MSSSSAAAQHDARRHRRVSLDVEVTMASESQFFVGISGNVSEGGLFVSTFRRLPVGELVEVNLVLDSGAPVRALGQVRWLRERSDHANPGFGVQFEQLDEDVREAIEQFCAERHPLYVEVD